MDNTFFLVPAHSGINLEKNLLSLKAAFNADGFSVANMHPIDISRVEHLLSQEQLNELLHEIVAMREEIAQNSDIVLMQGLSYAKDQPYVHNLNKEIAIALNAKVIILADNKRHTASVLEKRISILKNDYGKKNILGCIINNVTNAKEFAPLSAFPYNFYTPRRKFPHFSKQSAIKFAAKQFNSDYINNMVNFAPDKTLSAALFRHQLIKKARSLYKKILLPEGNEIRIIRAAEICAQKGIAECVLMGNAQEIQKISEQNGVTLSDKVKIFEPNKEYINKFAEPMAMLRKSKGLTIEQAQQQLKDYIVLATMMLQQEEADGVVAGAITSSAHTIRPALQLIKTQKNKKATSVFFMCFPEQVLVYGDCGVSLNPNAEELADIAIQSAETAVLFGIEPRIAMLSYSTHNSGVGIDVERVTAATNIIKTKRPDLIVDGPLQYDAAINEETAKIKAPNSPIRGKATVCIFSDLDSGNTAYKAAQRSAKISSLGPIVQGLQKPVNDLSRGCTTEDVVFTIAITAIQSSFNNKK